VPVAGPVGVVCISPGEVVVGRHRGITLAQAQSFTHPLPHRFAQGLRRRCSPQPSPIPSPGHCLHVSILVALSLKDG
jgi:hypothetical protein